MFQNYEKIMLYFEEIPEFLLYSYQNCCAVRLIAYLLVFVVAINIYLKYKSSRKRSSFPKDTVILHQFPRTVAFKLPSSSPYCLKLETWLRMAKIPYQNDFTFETSSKGKSPWITYNGTSVADSQFSIEYLAKLLNRDLNQLIGNNVEKAAARAFFKLAEESVYPCVGLCRIRYYPDPKRSGFPSLVLQVIKSKYAKAMRIQGYGRHTREEVFSIARNDLMAINDYIGSRKYLTGDSVCNEDSSLFGVLAQLVYQDCGEITEFVQNECPNIIRYMETIKINFWPDWSENIRNTPISSFGFICNYIAVNFF